MQSCVRCRIESQILGNVGVDCNRRKRCAGVGIPQKPPPICRRRHIGYVGNALALWQTYVIAKHKNFIFPYWSARGPAELIAAEGRFLQASGVLEEVGRVQGTVAQEFIRASVKLVGARTGDGVDYAARRITIFRRVVTREDREFLERVHAKVPPKHASWSRIRIII